MLCNITLHHITVYIFCTLNIFLFSIYIRKCYGVQGKHLSCLNHIVLLNTGNSFCTDMVIGMQDIFMIKRFTVPIKCNLLKLI